MILELTLRKIVPLSLFLFHLEKKKKAKHFFFKHVSYQGVKDSTVATLNLGRLRDVKHFFPKNSYSVYPFLNSFPHVFYIPGILKQQRLLIKGYY